MPPLSRRPRSVVVNDNRLGPLRFAATDQVIAPTIRAQGIWEPAEGLWLDQHVPEGGTVINVGANAGYFALWAAGLVGKRGRVVAVEPHPDNVAMLRRNIRRHARGVAEAVAAAASSTPGRIELFINDENAGDHRVFPPAAARAAAPDFAESTRGFAAAARTVEVPAVTVDEVAATTGRRIDVLFTDTQGHDHEVLAGARRTLAVDRPLVMMEFVPAWVTAQGADPVGVLKDLQRAGYAVGVWDAGIPPGDWDPERIVEWAARPGRWFTNLELWPGERVVPSRARPAAGFWSVERDGPHERYWLTAPTGHLEVSGPPGGRVRVDMTFAPPPGVEVVASVAGETVRVPGPTPWTLAVDLNGDGRATVPIRVDTPPVVLPGDGRELTLALLDPAVH